MSINANNAVNGFLIGPSLRSSFGEMLVVQPTASIQLQFPYNLNTRYVTTTVTGSGTVTQGTGKAICQTTAAASSSAKLVSNDALHYFSGQGAVALFTAVFTTGVANSTQFIGLADPTGIVDAFLFGYSGATFGIQWYNATASTFIAQTSWNADVMDGSGSGSNPSGVLLTKTNGNVYKIQFQYLGFGAINFFIENPNTGQFILVHQIKYTNANTAPSLGNPTLSLYMSATNTTNATNITLQTACMAGFVEGQIANLDTRNCFSSTSTFGSTTETHLLTIQDKTTFAGKSNRVIVYPDFISTDNTLAAAQFCTFNLYLNATLTGTTTFTDISTNTSVVAQNTAGTYSVGTGTLLFTFLVGGGSFNSINLQPYYIDLNPGSTLTLTVIKSNAPSATIDCSLGWFERF